MSISEDRPFMCLNRIQVIFWFVKRSCFSVVVISRLSMFLSVMDVRGNLNLVEIMKYAFLDCPHQDFLINHIPPKVVLCDVCFHGICRKLCKYLCTLREEFCTPGHAL